MNTFTQEVLWFWFEKCFSWRLTIKIFLPKTWEEGFLKRESENVLSLWIIFQKVLSWHIVKSDLWQYTSGQAAHLYQEQRDRFVTEEYQSLNPWQLLKNTLISRKFRILVTFIVKAKTPYVILGRLIPISRDNNVYFLQKRHSFCGIIQSSWSILFLAMEMNFVSNV